MQKVHQHIRTQKCRFFFFQDPFDFFPVVDHSKFEQGAFCKVGDFGMLSGVITDREPAEEWLQFFTEQGIRCYYPN